MHSQNNRPRYLWAYIGFYIFAGIITNFIINPISEKTALLFGPSAQHVLYLVRLLINLVVGFFIFWFIVKHFIVRPLEAKKPEES